MRHVIHVGQCARDQHVALAFDRALLSQVCADQLSVRAADCHVLALLGGIRLLAEFVESDEPVLLLQLPQEGLDALVQQLGGGLKVGKDQRGQHHPLASFCRDF